MRAVSLFPRQMLTEADEFVEYTRRRQLAASNVSLPFTDDRTRARRIGGSFLVLTRKTLSVLAIRHRPTFQGFIEATFLRLGRHFINQLRELDIADDPCFRVISARIRERIAQIRTMLPWLNDTSGALTLVEVELLVLSGDLAAAFARIGPLMRSISTVAGRELRDEIAVRYFDLCIGQMDSRSGYIALLKYLVTRSPSGRISQRFGRELRMIARHSKVLHGSGLRLSALVIRFWCRMAQIAPRRLFSPVADLAMQRIGLPALRREVTLSVGENSGRPRAVRAMGGLGDLLMMTPGLRALSKRTGHPVEFAIPRRYLGLFECNPYVSALGIEDIPLAWYGAGPIIDLTDCPASYIESRTAPAVKTNRIEIFAQAMGISARELRRHGIRPLFESSAAGRHRTEVWLRSYGLFGRAFIAIQSASAESYRTWNGMTDVARSLAELMPVVVFHDRPLGQSARSALMHENIKLAIGLDLMTGFSLACEARLILAPDSAFVHLAGARGVPCVGIFGPTDGNLRLGVYPEATVVSLAPHMTCIPCWRNQATPCMLTGGSTSQCLESLPVAQVVDAVKELLAATNPRVPSP